MLDPVSQAVSKLNLVVHGQVLRKAQELFRLAESKSILKRNTMALPFASLFLACELNCQRLEHDLVIRHSGLKKDKFHSFLNQIRNELKLSKPTWTFEQVCIFYGCTGILEKCQALHNAFKTKFVHASLQEKRFVNLDSQEAVLGVFFEVCKVFKTKVNSSLISFDSKMLKFYVDKLHQSCKEELAQLKEDEDVSTLKKIKSTAESKLSNVTCKPKQEALGVGKWVTGIRLDSTETLDIYSSKEFAQYLHWRDKLLTETLTF